MNSNFLRNIMVWVILGSLLMYVFNNIESANVREQISYSQFRQEVLSDRVAKVVYKGDQMTITGDRLDGSKFETNYPIFKRDDMLDKAWGLEPDSRLSCQAVTGKSDLVIEIPKYTINMVSENH